MTWHGRPGHGLAVTWPFPAMRTTVSDATIKEMPALPPNLDHFLRKLHRRFILLRTLERIGACLLLASAVSLLLLPLILWRGVPALPPVSFLFACSILLGLLAGTLRRPTRLDTAMEADRHLAL